MNCPLCVDQVLVPNLRTGIEIDVCPQCKGVWLDRGELDKLASGGPSEPAVVPAASPVQDVAARSLSKKADKKSENKSAKKQKKKKKKSSLGDRLGDILEDVLDL